MRHAQNLETVNTYEGTHDVHALILGRAHHRHPGFLLIAAISAGGIAAHAPPVRLSPEFDGEDAGISARAERHAGIARAAASANSVLSRALGLVG